MWIHYVNLKKIEIKFEKTNLQLEKSNLKLLKHTWNLRNKLITWKKNMHNLKLEKIPKFWKNMLGLFLNQTCFSTEQYGSNMVWTNVFQWNMVSKIKLEI